jgi:hypothetical protein
MSAAEPALLRAKLRAFNHAGTRAAGPEYISCKVARPEGFEPPTTWFEAICFS